jgi:hypothetical protein
MAGLISPRKVARAAVLAAAGTAAAAIIRQAATTRGGSGFAAHEHWKQQKRKKAEYAAKLAYARIALEEARAREVARGTEVPGFPIRPDGSVAPRRPPAPGILRRLVGAAFKAGTGAASAG